MAKGISLIIISATGFGLMPLFALAAYHGGATVPTLLFLRFAIAAILLFTYCLLAVRSFSLTATQLVTLLFLGGVLYTLQSMCYFSAVKYIPASLTALLLYTYPAFVAILSFFVAREPLTARLVSSILLTSAGLVLVLGVSVGRVNWIGVLLAVTAAVVYAVYIVVSNRLVSQMPPLLMASFVSLFASLSFLVMGLASGTLDLHLGWPVWGAIASVALFCTVLAILTFFAGLRYLGSTRASILSTWEPVVTALGSVLVLHQQLTWTQALGGAVVLLGAAVAAGAKKRPSAATAGHSEEQLVVGSECE